MIRKTLAVARREYRAAVRTKSFLISVLIMPLLFGGSIVVQLLLKDRVDVSEKRFAIIDRTPGESLRLALESAATMRNERFIYDETGKNQIKPAFVLERVDPSQGETAALDEQRFELSERVRRGELFGFLEVGGGVLQSEPAQSTAKSPESASGDNVDGSRSVRYQSNSPTYTDFRGWAEGILNDAVKEQRFRETGLPREVVQRVLTPVPVVVKGLTDRDADSGVVQEARDQNQAVAILTPAALMMLMFMLIMIGATPAMQGVVEEKLQKIAEMVLGSVTPFQLMMGKLLGLMGVSLSLALLYLSAAYLAAQRYGVAELVTPAMLAWFLIFLVLAVVMYGSLFIAVGAACSTISETQTMLWPVMLVATMPLFVWLNVAKEPSSAFSTVASLVPTATPILMIIRLAVPPGIPWWQPALGMALMLATTVASVYVAGRIFRVGILMQGKGANYREIARWVVRG